MTKKTKIADNRWGRLYCFSRSLNIQIPRSLSAGFFFLLLLLSIALTSGSRIARAEAKGAAVNSTETQEVFDITKPFGERRTQRGRIGAFNNDGMAFVTKVDKASRTENEMWLPFNETVRFIGYEDMSDLEQGDEAVVTYEEDKAKTRRVLREVNFVSKSAPAAADDEDSEPEAAQ